MEKFCVFGSSRGPVWGGGECGKKVAIADSGGKRRGCQKPHGTQEEHGKKCCPRKLTGNFQDPSVKAQDR